VNFELPMVAQDYVHRIGRTGRAGMEGDAVSLVCIDENALLADIETLLRQRITREVIPGFEVDRSIPREPIRQRSMGGGRQGTPRPAPRQPSRPARRPMFPESRPAASVAAVTGYAAARPATPTGPRPQAPTGFRPAASSGPRQASTMEFRRPIPSDFRQSAQAAPRQSAPGGFRRPVPSDFGQPASSGPRREPGGFRPIEPSRFANSGRPQSRYDSAPAYDPQPRYDTRPQHNSTRFESPARSAQGPSNRPYAGRPAQGPANRTFDRPGISAGRPASGGFRSNERAAAPASRPGERIARRGGRQD
jgi:superfamily II DNA/RNA helicase